MRTDFLKDETGDLTFETGNSNQQHIMDMLDAQAGEFKEFPTSGFGAINYIKRNVSEDEFKRDLKLALNDDGYTTASIDLSKGIENLTIAI